MTDRPTAADAQAASIVVGELWRALAEDDDATVLDLTTTELQAQIGTEAGAAERLREALSVDAARAARVGVSSKVRVVDDVIMVLMCMEVDPAQGYLILGDWGAELRHGWALYVQVEGGHWRVAGTYSQPPDGWPEGTRYLDLPHAPDSGRPKHRAIAPIDPHPSITEVAGALYRDGHYAESVFEAFKAVESRVRYMTKIDLVGHKLMSAAFGGENPRWSLTRRSGQMGRDEQEGRTLMLMGTMRAVRNLGGHERDWMDQVSAIELLGLASQMMRWLDEAALNL